MKIIDDMPKLRRHAVRFLAESRRDEAVLGRVFAIFKRDAVAIARMELHAGGDFNELVIEEIEGA